MIRTENIVSVKDDDNNNNCEGFSKRCMFSSFIKLFTDSWMTLFFTIDLENHQS